MRLGKTTMVGWPYRYMLRIFSAQRLSTVGRTALVVVMALAALKRGWLDAFLPLDMGLYAGRYAGLYTEGLLLALVVYTFPWVFGPWMFGLWVSGPSALRAHWFYSVAEAGLLALLIRATGGSLSPLMGLVYLWFFGALLYRHRSERYALPGVATLGLLALAAGAWGTPNGLLVVGINALGIVAASSLGFRLERERLEHRCDPLTRLFHRRAGMEALRGWTRRGTPFTLVFLDLRGFKTINDRYGHAVGDEVICAVAARLAVALRQGDLAMRYGGDEFVVASGAVALKERLERAFAAPLRTSVGVLSIGVDIGEARWQVNTSLEALLASADAAMYRDKARAYEENYKENVFWDARGAKPPSALELS